MPSLWTSVRRLESTDTNVLKFVFEKEDAVAEAVLYKYPTYNDRTVICCSTMSGCPVGCRFCGAGDAFVRVLTQREIVAQILHVLASEEIFTQDVQRFQIMFMSMGEPLLNMNQLIPTLHELYCMFPNAALLISTSAPRVDYSALLEVSESIPTVGLQFSIHETTDEARDLLIPFQAKLKLYEIAWLGERWFMRTGRRPFFNYCVHEQNSSIADADRLLRLFSPMVWEATISVICERNESVASATERQIELAQQFEQLLCERGFSTRIFNPGGQDDVGGGCGQLWSTQKWIKDHPDQIKHVRY